MIYKPSGQVKKGQSYKKTLNIFYAMSFHLCHKRSTKQKHELPPLLIKLDLWDVLHTYRKVGSRNPLLVLVCLYDLQVRSNKFNLSKLSLSQCFFTTPRGTRLSSEPFTLIYVYMDIIELII